jgi:hypothetical protein
MRLVVLVVLALAATRVVEASPESEKLFRDGKSLLKAGKLAEACEAFAQSQSLSAGVGTLLNLADCRERQGQTATAWTLFREAKALAERTKDKRATEATARAAALEANLAYFTVTVAADRRVEGLVIKRNGRVVDPALWNQPVPLDPGDYVIEGSAPKHEPWSATQHVTMRARASVAVELVAEPVVVAVVPESKPEPGHEPVLDPGTGPGITRVAPASRAPVPRLRDAAIGFGIGSFNRGDTALVGRILGNVALPGGALRGFVSGLYTNTQFERINDLTDSTNTTSVYSLGLALDYVWMPVPKFAFAAGLGAGVDYLVRDLDQATETNKSVALRASPLIVRLAGGHVELGLHLQLATAADLAFVGLVAVDVFPL